MRIVNTGYKLQTNMIYPNFQLWDNQNANNYKQVLWKRKTVNWLLKHVSWKQKSLNMSLSLSKDALELRLWNSNLQLQQNNLSNFNYRLNSRDPNHWFKCSPWSNQPLINFPQFNKVTSIYNNKTRFWQPKYNSKRMIWDME